MRLQSSRSVLILIFFGTTSLKAANVDYGANGRRSRASLICKLILGTFTLGTTVAAYSYPADVSIELHSYPTDEEQDRNLLADGKTFEEQSNAVAVAQLVESQVKMSHPQWSLRITKITWGLQLGASFLFDASDDQGSSYRGWVNVVENPHYGSGPGENRYQLKPNAIGKSLLINDNHHVTILQR